MEFAYHMYGSGMGSLEVKLNISGVLDAGNLFEERGDQGDKWVVEQLVIPRQTRAYKVKLYFHVNEEELNGLLRSAASPIIQLEIKRLSYYSLLDVR
jgi:hypothetical protein